MPVKEKTKKIRATPIPPEYRREVREGLLKSRDLMNDDGDHWTQGEYKRSHPMHRGQFQWCAVGGLREMLRQDTVEQYAVVALAERGVPADDSHRKNLRREYSGRLQQLREEWEYEKKHYPYSGILGDKPTSLPLEHRAAICEDVVTGWNDHPGRTWAEVAEAFTRAAAAVRVRRVPSA
jgi:hypothetical protein